MPFKHNESCRHHIKPMKYKITNWSDYNQALQERGNITLWIGKDCQKIG